MELICQGGAGLGGDGTDEVGGKRGFARGAIRGRKRRRRDDLIPVQLLHSYRPANRLFGNRTLVFILSMTCLLLAKLLLLLPLQNRAIERHWRSGRMVFGDLPGLYKEV